MARSLKEHNYFGIDATIIADSKNKFGNRITSFVITFPRIILAEFNTHRLFSRNSASSRAIPTNVMLERVKNHPFIPKEFQKFHKGMQGNFVIKNPINLQRRHDQWLTSRDLALYSANKLNEEITETVTMKSLVTLDKEYYLWEDSEPVTKQLINRILEPYLWHTVIVTSSEYENYFNLRDHPAAEIHIDELAKKMKYEFNNSSPILLNDNEYHIPFGDSFNDQVLTKLINKLYPPENEKEGYRTENKFKEYLTDLKIKIAIARCARVSYGNFEGSDDYLKDINLYKTLSTMGHWSPFEHVAKCMNNKEYNEKWVHIENGVKEKGWCRNMRGFIQIRAKID